MKASTITRVPVVAKVGKDAAAGAAIEVMTRVHIECGTDQSEDYIVCDGVYYRPSLSATECQGLIDSYATVKHPVTNSPFLIVNEDAQEAYLMQDRPTGLRGAIVQRWFHTQYLERDDLTFIYGNYDCIEALLKYGFRIEMVVRFITSGVAIAIPVASNELAPIMHIQVVRGDDAAHPYLIGASVYDRN